MPRTKHLVTAALPYANGPLHIGNLLEHVQVDVLTRALRMAGEDVLVVCGADCHGTPIELNAMKAGVAPEEFVARWRHEHEVTLERFGIHYDGGYGSTHTDENRTHAERIYRALEARGRLRRRHVAQFYDAVAGRFLPDRFLRGTCPFCAASDQYGDACEVCHKTYLPTDLVDPRSAITGTAPVRKTSEHIFVDLASFRDVLEEWIQRPGVVAEPVRNYLKSWMADLREWDISRDGPYFGFPIPGHTNKYFYVWLDAPVGYIALTERAARERGRTYEDYWRDPNTRITHCIGKDILYFHTLFWPALLSAAADTLPTKVAVHGWLTLGGAKMSKTKGKQIAADDLADALGPAGIEAVRYYFACRLDDAMEDVDFNVGDFVERVNADLVNNVINLISRAASLLGRHYEGKLGPMDPAATAVCEQVRREAAGDHGFEASYRAFRFSDVTRRVAYLGSIGNKYLQDEKPWEIGRSDPERARNILTTALWIGKVCIAALAPIVPRVARGTAALLDVSGFTFAGLVDPLPEGRRIARYERLFERLELGKLEPVMLPRG